MHEKSVYVKEGEHVSVVAVCGRGLLIEHSSHNRAVCQWKAVFAVVSS